MKITKKILLIINIILILAAVVYGGSFLWNNWEEKKIRENYIDGNFSTNNFSVNEPDIQKYYEKRSAEKSKSKIIDVELAKFVATEALISYYPEENYSFIDYLSLHDLNGELTNYAILFAKPDSKITSIKEYYDNISKTRPELDKIDEQLTQIKQSKNYSKNDELLLKREYRLKKEALYQWNNLAHIITSAINTEKPVYDHGRGFPEFMSQKSFLQKTLDTDYADMNAELGRVVFFDASSIYHVVVPKGKTAAEEEQIPSNWSLIDKEGKLKKVSSMLDQIKNSETKKSQAVILMTPEERRLYEQGILESEKENIKKWKEYEQKYQNQ